LNVRLTILTLVFGVASALAGCAAQLPLLGEADAARASQRWPGTTVADLQRGRELYVNHCSSCHTLYRPQDLPADKWRTLVGEMQVRAKLAPEQAETISRYLVAAAEAPPAPR
jgi:mono/diheme cytochrome c family protein